MLSYSTENWMVSGGETERKPTFGVKYATWISSYETLGNEELLKILV